MFTEGATTLVRCNLGIPPDACFLCAYTEDQPGAVWLVFEHPSFDIVPLGHVLRNIGYDGRDHRISEELLALLLEE